MKTCRPIKIGWQFGVVTPNHLSLLVTAQPRNVFAIWTPIPDDSIASEFWTLGFWIIAVTEYVQHLICIVCKFCLKTQNKFVTNPEYLNESHPNTKASCLKLNPNPKVKLLK